MNVFMLTIKGENFIFHQGVKYFCYKARFGFAQESVETPEDSQESGLILEIIFILFTFLSINHMVLF